METCAVSECTCKAKKTGKVSKNASHEVSPELSISEDMSAMSLMEREQQALAAIAQIELEDQVFEMEDYIIY